MDQRRSLSLRTLSSGGAAVKIQLGRACALIAILGAALTAGVSVAVASQPPPYGGSAPTVVSGAGDITPVVELYRNLLGPNNGGDPGSRTTGRRKSAAQLRR